MDLVLAIREEAGHLFVQAVGQFALADMKEFIHTVRTECDKRGFDRVLADITGVLGRPGQFDRFLMGQHVAQLWRPGLKAAVVFRAEDINKFTESVAVSRGADMRIFPDKESALAWLLADEPPPTE